MPRPINFSVLIGNTKKLLKDEYKRPSQFGLDYVIITDI